MSALARRSRNRADIWPGFVDALASLLMVMIFLLLVFVLAQFFLGEALSGRETALQKLDADVAELTDLLSLERKANEGLRGDVARLSGDLESSLRDRDDQAAEIGRLSGDVTRLEALKAQLETDIGKLATNLEQSETALLAEKDISESARAEIALLNQQLGAINDQIATLNDALDAAERKAREQEVQIVSLGQRLNAALASKVQELSAYRSEFFGRLKEALGDQPGILISGDRFVFQSEVLFASGEAELGEGGKVQMRALAATLKEASAKIPDDIDWVLRVDGHTDKVPIHTPKFASNWELSSARAISVVKFLIAEGIAPKRLAAAGFGEYQPLDERDSPLAHSINRRIELKLTQR